MEKRGKWTIKKDKNIFKSHFIQLTESDVITPKSKPGKYISLKIRDGVAVLPVDENGYVYLIEEFSFVLNKSLLTAPKGAIEDGEEPITAAKRELKEEVGFEAEEWKYLGETKRLPNLMECSAHLFIAKKLKKSKMSLDDDEDITIKKVKFEDAYKLALESKITEDSSCVLILRAKEFLKI